ncbi:hypothetical protein AB2M62_17690 [Sphingomonas sp. MMS12-HWE2-04]|uniref:hypothetical protein n=1 Tax=Sphingomonas sp. MMS12-HWE2-04 TaxID=3234199 RepID=UPI00384AFD4E
MKFLPRAATFAAVTFCAGALANAATLDMTPEPQQVIQAVNVSELDTVPALHGAAAQTTPAKAGEVVQPLPDAALQEDEDFATLSAAVAAQEAAPDRNEELNCLATGI